MENQPTPAMKQAAATGERVVNVALTVNEVNSVLQVLNSGPYSTVRNLIEKILSQVQGQLQPQVQPPPVGMDMQSPPVVRLPGQQN